MTHCNCSFIHGSILHNNSLFACYILVNIIFAILVIVLWRHQDWAMSTSNAWSHSMTVRGFMIRVMVLNVTFNNISVISWRSALLVEEIGVSREYYRPVASHWQTLSHNVVWSTPLLSGIRTHNVAQVVVNPTTIQSRPNDHCVNWNNYLRVRVVRLLFQWYHGR